MPGFYNWILNHTALISAVANTLMIFIWLAYAHMFYQNYKRQRRPRLLLNQALGSGLNAVCILSNMSEEAIHIESVTLKVASESEEFHIDVTDQISAYSLDASHTEHRLDKERWSNETLQGPLGSGGSRLLGSFREFLVSAAKASGDYSSEESFISQTVIADRQAQRFKEIEVRIVAIYGSEDKPIGASRMFIMRQDGSSGQLSVAPKTFSTVRMSTRRQRVRVQKWLEQNYYVANEER